MRRSRSRFFGEDLDTLRALAEAFRSRLARSGVVDLQVEKQVRIPQLEIIVDYRRAALYGLQPSAVTEQLETTFERPRRLELVDGKRRFDVVLRLQDAQRTTQGLGDLLMESPSGWVPVRQIADVAKPTAPTRSCARTASGAWSCWPIPTARPT